MRFWFARNSGVTIRQQLVTQLVLGIVCNDLEPGQKLPSIRAFARRFRLHPNTVSAAYRELSKRGWVEFRRGSGVYVRSLPPPHASSAAPEALIADLVVRARSAGLSLAELRRCLARWLETKAPDKWLLIEPDEELRRIAVAELASVASLPVEGTGLPDPTHEDREGFLPVVFPSRAAVVRERLGSGTDILVLEVRSAPSSLQPYLPAKMDALVGIASRWTGFLDAAHTMLIAAGFPAESLLVCDARHPGWQRGIEAAAVVVCDILTARALPAGTRAIPFPVIADTSLAELRRRETLFCDTPAAQPQA